MDFKALVDDVYPQVVAWRRHLHQHPETSWEERATSAYLGDRLREMGLEPRVVAGTGVVADVSGAADGPCLALRADIDALAIQEESGASYASLNPGKMHACGHDAHMAMLLGAAHVLCAHRDRLAGRVRLIFQPAEETPPADAPALAETGSVAMVDAGALDGVDTVVGVHIFSSLPVGHIGLVAGPIMAGSAAFDATITGRGGHAGMPAGTVDALAVAAHAVTALRSAATLGSDPTEPLVIHVGRLQAGTARTAVAETAELEGTIRFVDPDRIAELHTRIERTLRGVADAVGAQVDVRFGPHVNPPVVNDSRVVAALQPLCEAIVGRERVLTGRPQMGAEDFWAYLDHKPGAFVLIGGGNEAKGITAGHHSPHFDIDEEGMKTGIELWLRLALEGLVGVCRD